MRDEGLWVILFALVMTFVLLVGLGSYMQEDHCYKQTKNENCYKQLRKYEGE
jgi:hypothetical protein